MLPYLHGSYYLSFKIFYLNIQVCKTLSTKFEFCFSRSINTCQEQAPSLTEELSKV